MTGVWTDRRGLQWRPKARSAVTFEEFESAGARFLDLPAEAERNPWDRDQLRAEGARLVATLEQWERAEPGHRYMSSEEYKAWNRQMDEERAARTAAQVAAREARVQQYSSERSSGRLALLEAQASLADSEERLTGLRSHQLYPDMRARPRGELIIRASTSVEAYTREVANLGQRVGDPEAVVDERGWLPRERRSEMLSTFASRRRSRVPELQQFLAEAESRGGVRDPNWKRSDAALFMARAELDRLLALPPQSADDMCSECPTPSAWHTYVGWLAQPCRSWPHWAQQMAEARELLKQPAAKSVDGSHRSAKPVGKTLAVLKPETPLDELLAKLRGLQAEHPRAVLKLWWGKLYIVEPPENSGGGGRHARPESSHGVSVGLGRCGSARLRRGAC
jgi:hypothetical protein